MGERVLVVDDEAATAQVTAALLRRSGYDVEVALSGQDGVRRALRQPPDLMLLDFDMPDLDAAGVLERLCARRERPSFPVVILTGARLSPGDQITGLDRGASDYIVKGVDRHVLLARIRRALRDARDLDARPRTLTRGRLVIDPEANQVWVDGIPVNLQPKSFLVLYHLAQREGAILTRAELLHLVWKSDYAGFEHAVEQAVYALRKALGQPGWIETVPRRGYRFVGRA